MCIVDSEADMAHFGTYVQNSSSICKQFGNFRHNKKPGQYDEEYLDDDFSSLQFLVSQNAQYAEEWMMNVHKIIVHTVIACSAMEAIVTGMMQYEKLARQEETTKTSPERSIYKLTDFVTAKPLDNEEEQLMSLYGTEEYLHPDMHERAVLHGPDCLQFTLKVDTWSLGVIFCHIVTGQLIFIPYGDRRNRWKLEMKEGSMRQEMSLEQQISSSFVDVKEHPNMHERAVLLGTDFRQFTLKVDIWSLEVTIYQVATGQLIFMPYGDRRNRWKIERKQESLLLQKMTSEQQTNASVEVYELQPISRGSNDLFMAQGTDINGVQRKDIVSYDLNRTDLNHFFGADNIPLHICVNLQEILLTTAELVSEISSHSLSIKCLSMFSEDLEIFTFEKTRLRGTKCDINLLMTKDSNRTEIGCCEQETPVGHVKNRSSIKEENNESPTTRVNADKTGNHKLDKEEALDRKIKMENVHKVAPGRMFGVALQWIMNTHYKQGYMCVLVILILLSLVQPTFESAILNRKREIGTDGIVHKFPLPKSWCPNPENTTCTIKKDVLGDKIEHCGYMCQSWEYIKCINYGNMSVYVCIPRNTSCQIGIGWQIERVEPAVDGVGEDSVFIKEDVCVEGMYQPNRSKCFDACKKRHIQQSHIPEGFMILKKGDHTHPALLMCNATAGFYNPHNHSYIYLDGSFSQDFCIHISVSNPCSSGQSPIHNGTCVNNCDPGFRRNEMDFSCEEIIGIPDSSQTNSTEVPPVTVKKSTTPTNERSSDIPVEVSKGSTESGKKEHISDSTPLYLIVLISVVVVIFVVMWIVIGVFAYKFICKHSAQGSTYIYHAVPYAQDTTKRDVNNSSASSSVGDESTFNAKDRNVSEQSVVEMESLSSNQSLKDDEGSTGERGIDAEPALTSIVPKTDSLPRRISSADDEGSTGERGIDAESASTHTVTKTNSLPRSLSSTGNADQSTVVKKKTQYTKNIILKINNLGAINFGNGCENVEDIINRLCRGLEIPESDVMEVEDSENTPRSSRTYAADESTGPAEVNTGPAEENTGPAEESTGPAEESKGPAEISRVPTKKMGTGEEFAKPNINSMTQLVVNGFAEYMKSVGALIYNGEVVGTVFRAGDDCVITAFHVIRRIIDPHQTGLINYALLEAPNVHLNFNATVCETPCFEYKVCHRFSPNDPRLDYTVLQITSRFQLPKKMKLDRHNHNRLEVNSLSGIGYGDPENGVCKVLDPYCRIISPLNGRILACEDWLHAENNKNFNYFQKALIALGKDPDIVSKGYRGIDREQNIFLDISMEHKGSGSPFLTSDGKVVGILTHGHPEFYFRLPALVRSGFPKDKRFETVLKLEYVYQDIFARDEDLAKKLFVE